MFITFYARAARSLALMSECYSGLFLTGKAILIHREKILQKEFMETFEQHDKRSDVLRKIPVYLVTNNDVGLYGCCNVTVNFFNI
jgi:glucokinase